MKDKVNIQPKSKLEKTTISISRETSERLEIYSRAKGIFQKDSILVIADLIHGAALQFKHPEYCPTYDMDPKVARESRIRILKYAKDNHLTMYGMHLPDPGMVK